MKQNKQAGTYIIDGIMQATALLPIFLTHFHLTAALQWTCHYGEIRSSRTSKKQGDFFAFPSLRNSHLWFQSDGTRIIRRMYNELLPRHEQAPWCCPENEREERRIFDSFLFCIGSHKWFLPAKSSKSEKYGAARHQEKKVSQIVLRAWRCDWFVINQPQGGKKKVTYLDGSAGQFWNKVQDRKDIAEPPKSNRIAWNPKSQGVKMRRC